MAGTFTRKGHAKRLQLSFLKKEINYAAGVAAGADYQLMSGYVFTQEPDNMVTDNREEVHGSEFPTVQEITEFGEKFPYETPKLLPNELAGFSALSMGGHTVTADGAGAAKMHHMLLVAEGTELPSIGAILDPVNQQETAKGVKCNGFELSSDEKGHIALTAPLITSGELTDSASAWQSAVVETLMRSADSKIYLNDSFTVATDLVAFADIVQNDNNIDAEVHGLTSIGPRVKSWRFAFSNEMEEIRGHGGGGYNQDIDYGPQRPIEFEMTLRYKDKTERDYFLNQSAFAVEINNARTLAGLIDVAGSWYYGFDLRIPKIQLREKPIPQGGAADPYELPLIGTIMDDGTNPIYDLSVFNLVPLYLA